MTQQNPSTPDWGKINLPEEYKQDLQRLLEIEEKLKLAHALGCAIIRYMHSPAYADTQGECLEMAFFEATQYKA